MFEGEASIANVVAPNLAIDYEVRESKLKVGERGVEGGTYFSEYSSSTSNVEDLLASQPFRFR